MKALVIGGSQFVGLHLVQELVRQGHEVTVFNRGRTPVTFPQGVERLYGDRKEAPQIRSALSGRDFDWAFDISAYVEEDISSMTAVLQGQVGRYVFCSTVAVYARSELMPVKEDFPLDRRPQAGPYAANKIKGEDFLCRAYQEQGFPMTIVRPSMVYGPDNNIPQREPSFFARLLAGRTVVVPGYGHNLLQFGHVDDLAVEFILAAQSPRALGQAYNFTGPDAITINGYIAMLGRIVGMEPQVVHLTPETVRSLERPPFPYDWQRSTIYSMDKAKEELGFRHQFTMEAGLVHCYQWYCQQDPARWSFDFSYEDELIRRYGRGA